jgi:hypothetical protein
LFVIDESLPHLFVGKGLDSLVTGGQLAHVAPDVGSADHFEKTPSASGDNVESVAPSHFL